MIFIVLLIIWLLGFALISFLQKDMNLVLKTGLAMLTGLGLQSVFMLVFDLVHVPISLGTLMGTSGVLASGLVYFALPVLKTDLKTLKSFSFGIGQINFTWLFFAGIIIYILYGIGMKGKYWPVAEFDSVTGYDFMGKMIAREGVLRVSVFDYSTNSSDVPRFIYPPLIAGSFSLQYLCGETAPRIIPLVFFASMLLSFYGAVRYFTTHTASVISTAFMAATPEMCSHGALALTNLPNASYAATSLIVLYLYLVKNEIRWLYIAALLMALTLFSRSDSIVFSAAAMGVLLIQAIRSRNFKPLIIYALVANSLFVAWTMYTKLILKTNAEDFFEKTLFWDAEKLDKILTYISDFIVTDTQLYGLGFWLFFLFVALNIKHLRQDLSLFLLVSLGAWFLYTFLYYQMNYHYISLDAFMKASYKRGMFCFVPLVWFYVTCNRLSVWLFRKIDQFLYH